MLGLILTGTGLSRHAADHNVQYQRKDGRHKDAVHEIEFCSEDAN